MRPVRTRTVAAALALLPCVLLADAVAGRAVLYERDIAVYWMPAIEAFVRAVTEGAWPLWDPLTNFGRPMLSDPSMQLAYPPTWLNLILSPGPYYTLFVVAHCAWAGVGALFLGRAWGLSVAAAACAGALWMLSGPFLSMASLYHHFSSASWMPWVLVALECVLRRPGPRPVAWLGVAASGLALAGSADLCVMTGAACVVRVAFAVASDRRGLVSRRTIIALAASGALASLLCAVQWWGTLVNVAAGSRVAMGSATNMFWSMHPASLIDLVIPRLVAEMPLGTEWRAAVFEARAPLLRSLYVGVPALFLAACALASGSWPMRWLAAILAVAFLFAALGRFTPVYPALVGLPLIRLLRFPVKYMVPASLFLSLLSGAGVDALRQEWDDRARRRIWIVVVVTAFAAVAFIAAAASSESITTAVLPGLDASHAAAFPVRLRDGCAGAGILAMVAAGAMALRASGRFSRLLAGPVLLLVAADLFVAGRSAIHLGPPELLRHRPSLLDAFPRPAEHRVYRWGYGLPWLNGQFTRVPAGWDPEWAWVLGSVERLAAPISTAFGISGSFDGDFTGLAPILLTRLTAAVHAGPDEPQGLRLLQMASVTDVVSFEDTLAGRPPRVERWSVYTKPVRVFTVPDALPRAYLVSGVRIDTPPDETSVVADPGFDARREVALDSSSGLAASPPQDDPGRAEILARRSDRLQISVAARRPVVLVVTESYDPGWRAWVDGTPAPVWRANAIFRGVPVPEGDHLVEMRYRPPAVAWGAAASTLGVVIAALLLGRRKAA